MSPRRSSLDERYLALVRSFDGYPNVTCAPTKGFGSGALKFRKSIFAMRSSRGEFVVKLPAARVDELVREGKGTHFRPGGNRVMKEWLAVEPSVRTWLELAREAHAFASGASAR